MGRRELVGLAILSIGIVTHVDEPTVLPPGPTEAARNEDKTGRSESTIAERFTQIQAELDARNAALVQEVANAESLQKKRELVEQNAPNEVDYYRRIVDLVTSSPANPSARDALLWVINRSYRGDTGPYGDEFARAAALLVRHHGDDPEAVRIGLSLDKIRTFHRESLLLGFYATAKNREARGLARMALAQYLTRKATDINDARKTLGRPNRRLANGKVIEIPDERYAYVLHLRQCDPDIVRSEAGRLYEEIISEYSDVPYLTRGRRELEALQKELEPKVNGKALTDADRRRIEKTIAREKTLGDEAIARLDEMFNLTVGKLAPEIDGVGINGDPLKLSDYRGKVVVLVFWGSWCGPCMAEVPNERELVERLKGRPFALLGVDCEANKEMAIKVMEREQMTWPNWFDGPAGEGPIGDRYHIRSYPTSFVLDSNGVIRNKDLRGKVLEEAVDRLLQEAEIPARE